MNETTGAVGTLLPDLLLPRLDGGELALADQRGRKLLLFFWGSW
jgi:peroxiredoxin